MLFNGMLLTMPCVLFSGVTFVGQADVTEGVVAPVSVLGHWYTKDCKFKRLEGLGSPIIVFRGGALAMESCSVEQSEIQYAEDCEPSITPEGTVDVCSYQDGTAFTGAYLKVDDVIGWNLMYLCIYL
jgi:hypothetical protein